jgi:DNA-binding LacI/PurR family transcriptional regulator
MLMPDPPSRPITIYDVARATNVSPTTVSHAYSGKRYVEPETRARILAVAKSLGYRPSRPARALRTGRTNTIAFIVPATATTNSQEVLALDYYMELAVGAARASFTRGYPMVIAPSFQSQGDIRDLATDGVIIVDPRKRDRRIDLCLEAGVPVVTIDRDAGRPEHDEVVRADNEGDMTRLLEHLTAAGARQIGLVAPSTSGSWALETRLAYREWCRAHRQRPMIERAPVHAGRESGAEAAGRLFDRPHPPDAVIALESQHVFGVLSAARTHRIDVPGELLVATGTDCAEARFGTPSVTAIDVMPAEQGSAAANMLVDLVEGIEHERPVVSPSQLRVRQSTTRHASAGDGKVPAPHPPRPLMHSHAAS